MVEVRLTESDAFDFIKIVKETYQDKPQVYKSFLEIMNDFKAERMDTRGVISKVKELFKGEEDLLLVFNTFLPKGFEITLESGQTLPDDVYHKKAIIFMNKVKTRFQGINSHGYNSFLDILNMYRKEKKSIADMDQEVAILFRNHQDLHAEFAHFLPNFRRI